MQSLASPEAAEEMGQRVRDLLHRLSDLPVPVVAVLNGYALGGGTEIALACDLCVIEEHAVFQFKQVRMGLLTGWGGGGRLVHRLGYARALELVATARALGSEEALALGIAQKRAPSGQGLDAALEWARAFERGSGRSIAAFKRLFRFASTRDPRAVGEEEQRLLADLFLSPDHQEALAAFFEKRSPEFGR